MKPFDIELAKAGYPVCTRDGRDVRIICFNRNGDEYPIIALIPVPDNNYEGVFTHNIDGKAFPGDGSSVDLMMKPVKKEGWINIYKAPDTNNIYSSSNVYNTKEKAIKDRSEHYIDTIKIEWEE